MRIAVSGTHAAGKSTLVAELSALLPDHLVVDEPYHLLAEEGHEFAEMPSVDDFELQLARSIDCVSGIEPDVVFDRSPADFLAYLQVHPDGGGVHLPEWLPRVRTAIARLDLIVYVPVEARDRIALPASEDPRFRRRVDAAIREILLDDPWDFGVDVLEVAGSPRERARHVKAHLRAGRGTDRIGWRWPRAGDDESARHGALIQRWGRRRGTRSAPRPSNSSPVRYPSARPFRRSIRTKLSRKGLPMIRVSPLPLTVLGFLLATSAGCAASASAGGAGEAGGGPAIVRRAVAEYEFYDVPGSTAAELAAEMDELGPVVEGRPAVAATFWDVGWTVRTESAAGVCVVRRVEMRLDVRVALPRWSPPASASSALVTDWDRFVRAVSEHEAGHVDLAAEAARRVRSRLTGMSGPNCTALMARAREEGDEIVAKYRELNRRFDERTVSEAEKWPPSRGWRGP